ncbi:hypothetical protein C8F01DRAFT_1192845 [Mycena amicta]|nr:hypothetical protein C8F01DRAFT_1192845 [Mycena amicta]
MSAESESQALSVLRAFFQTSRSLSAKCQSHLSGLTASTNQPRAPPVTALPKYDLPLPSSISERLVVLGLTATHAEKLSAQYLSSCEVVRSTSQKLLRTACEEISSLPHHSEAPSRVQRLLDGLAATHKKQYFKELQRLEDGVYSIVPRLKKAIQAQGKKDDFNYDFLPYLETFFSHNCAPSKADQLVMAKKSGMSRKQIQVWFQNHRSRSRSRRQRGSTSDENAHTDTQAGPGMVVLPLRKMHPDDRARDVCLKTMEARLGDVYVVPEALRQQAGDDVYANAIKGLWDGELQEEEDEDELEAEAEEEEESLSTPEPDTPFDFMRPLDLRSRSSPPTLAPLSFADLCQTPSPQTQTLPHFQFSFPAPQWRRCPAPETTTIRPWDDDAWDGLITAFAGLHIDGQSPSDSNARAGPGFKSATTTVIPSCAPLSALVSVSVGCARMTRSLPTLRRRTLRHQFGRSSLRPGKIPALPSRFPSWCISEGRDQKREEEPVAKRRRCT